MPVIRRTIQVGYELRVFFTRNAFDPANPLLRDVLSPGPGTRPARVLAVVDAGLAVARPALAHEIEDYFAGAAGRLELVRAPVPMEGGERAKNSADGVSEIHSHIDRHHVDRHSYVLAIGGGALLDVAGFAAATAHRGVRLVRVPTTTLSQADSGVGVKNGINAFGKKNFIGTFAPPHAVINDSEMLATLPAREKRAGCVEAVKVALIRNREFFEALEADAGRLAGCKPDALQRMIQRCAELHLDHIASSGDPFESGSARPLDFGHWAGHKLEQLSGYRIRHGEAVAIGIALDVLYSRNAGFLDAASAERALELLEGIGFKLWDEELAREDGKGLPAVLAGLEEFREHLGGELAVTLLRGIGEGFEVHEMQRPLIVEAIGELAKRAV
jgi:3-dehydroquinate synthase